MYTSGHRIAAIQRWLATSGIVVPATTVSYQAHGKNRDRKRAPRVTNANRNLTKDITLFKIFITCPVLNKCNNFHSFQEVVNRWKNTYDYWIGLKKDAQGKWRWSDDTLYTGKIAPEDGSQLDCAYLNSHIGALHCSSQRRWICTKDPN
ncbi:hypothetical protein FKM82_011115 [Ascaphus truei]